MLRSMEQQTCPHCHTPITETNYFCPNCGKKLKDPPLSTGIGKQIGIYLLSAFLPPFGFMPSIRYLRQKDDKAKIIGIIALVLTIISTVINIWFFFQIYEQISSSLVIPLGL